jgi:ketosteroid isomerase-like protein
VAGARTPEELETMLEDAFVLHDHEVLAQLFEPEAVLHTTGSPYQVCGREQIKRFVTRMWDDQSTYLADPRTVLQAQGTALMVSGRAINVVRRGKNGTWRYAIVFLTLDRAGVGR